MTCTAGHTTRWKSQPTIARAAVGNILLASAILFSGCLFNTFHLLSSLFNLVTLGKSTYYAIQKQLLCPVINKVWTDHIGALHIVASGENLKLCGDGRCDSPGYSAKYCTYTLMEATTNLIFDFELMHVAMTNFNSGTMEREGLRNLLTRLDDAPFNISQVATDRSAQIKAMMRDDFGHIAHQFDVWHFAKSIVKKLTKATTKKEMEMLRNWIPSISNHLWWCSQTCGGSSTIIVEKWVSLVHHIANKHAWVDAKHFMACEHECLTEDESRQWLSPGSEQHQALTKIVTDKTVLRDIEKLTDFSHTGERNYNGVWHA